MITSLVVTFSFRLNELLPDFKTH